MLWGRELEKHALTILVNSPLNLDNIERKIQDYKIRWHTFFEKTWWQVTQKLEDECEKVMTLLQTDQIYLKLNCWVTPKQERKTNGINDFVTFREGLLRSPKSSLSTTPKQAIAAFNLSFVSRIRALIVKDQFP